MDKIHAKKLVKMRYENAPLENNSTLCKCALSFAGCHSKMDMTRNIMYCLSEKIENKTSKIDVIPVSSHTFWEIFVPLQQNVYYWDFRIQ